MTITTTNVSSTEQKKLSAQLGAGFTKKNAEKVLINQTNQINHLTETDLQPTDTLYLKNNSDSEYHVNTTTTKIFMEGCKNVQLYVNDRVITHTLEVWKCENVKIHLKTKVQTVQVDMCQGADIHFETVDDFNRLVWSATEDLSLQFVNAPGKLVYFFKSSF